MFRGAAAGVARTAGWCVTPDSSRTCAGVCAATRGAITLFISVITLICNVLSRVLHARAGHILWKRPQSVARRKPRGGSAHTIELTTGAVPHAIVPTP
jgi:hypothetical protein